MPLDISRFFHVLDLVTRDGAIPTGKSLTYRLHTVGARAALWLQHMIIVEVLRAATSRHRHYGVLRDATYSSSSRILHDAGISS